MTFEVSWPELGKGKSVSLDRWIHLCHTGFVPFYAVFHLVDDVSAEDRRKGFGYIRRHRKIENAMEVHSRHPLTEIRASDDNGRTWPYIVRRSSANVRV